MAFKPIDPKRDEYRRYLEHTGVIESLTKVLIRILKERPENPMDYLVHNMGYSRLQADNVAYLQSELKEAHQEINRLSDIIRSINPELLSKTTQQESCEEVANAPSEGCIENADTKVEASQESTTGMELFEMNKQQTNTDVYVGDNADNAMQRTRVDSSGDCTVDVE